MRNFLSDFSVVFVFCASTFAMAAHAMDYVEQRFEGSLMSVPVPAGWLAEYQAAGDVVVIGDGHSKGFLMAIGPDQAPLDYLKDALQEMNVPELAAKVRVTKVAGYDAAVLDNVDLVYEKYVAIKKSGVLLVLYGTSKQSAEELTPFLDVIAQNTQIVPSEHPAALVGRYRILNSKPLAMRAPLSPPDEEPVLDASGSYAGAGSLPAPSSGSWARRGNRLIVENGDKFSNYYIETTHQGLTLTDQDGLVSHWVRQ
ncbi:MAG TPA: hypothetical protein VFV48_02465 [Pseudomonadales bacterium]|nr:hypothetical protein [Pseudomonadales bacterium]